MAENESIDCPCSNIAIMQLFHELKQKYPKVPDQLVSKVIQENYHDKCACETILQRENHIYLQSYPGAIISGNSRDSLERGSLCNQCPASRPLQQSCDVSHPPQCAVSNNKAQSSQASLKQENAFSVTRESSIYPPKANGVEQKISNSPFSANPRAEETPKPDLVREKIKNVEKVDFEDSKMKKNLTKEEDSVKSSCDKKVENFLKFPSRKPEDVVSELGYQREAKTPVSGSENNSLNSSRTCVSECDSERISESSERSQSCERPLNFKNTGYSELETVRWNVEEGGRISGGASGVITRSTSSGQVPGHNYQVAVQYSLQPVLPHRLGDNQRSFTTVNLSLRPPSSQPQPPIEIQSGQNLTYTTSVFDAKKGVQSQLQIRIGPGGGGTVSACRTYISSPQTRYSCSSPFCTTQFSTGFHCQNNHRLKALLEKQRERKDLLARELRKEKEKLRCMQNDVRIAKASIAQKPSPHLLPKLKAEIERLRSECERLTAAVDLYSDTQNNVPLGETDEEFYRNIYTGQRLQREGSWSCQLCTFRNHPLLSVCEECEMPRISLGTEVMDVTSHLSNVLSNNNTSFCSGGGTSTSASLITAPLQVGIRKPIGGENISPESVFFNYTSIPSHIYAWRMNAIK